MIMANSSSSMHRSGLMVKVQTSHSVLLYPFVPISCQCLENIIIPVTVLEGILLLSDTHMLELKTQYKVLYVPV